MNQLTRIALSLVFAGLISLSGCGKQAETIDNAELSQAVQSVKYMTSKRWLSKSAFRSSYPDGKPSDYVNYLFSDFGVSEWPIALDEMEADQLKSARIPPLPPTVVLVPNQPDPSETLQVVIRAVDGEGLVIIEAYEDPNEPPIVREERVLPP